MLSGVVKILNESSILCKHKLFTQVLSYNRDMALEWSFIFLAQKMLK